MSQSHWTGPVFVTLLSLVAAGCSSTGSPAAPPGDDGGADAEMGDAGAEAGPSMLTVHVYERGWPALLALTTKPLAGIQVTADLPNGTRQEAKTDQNGTASFGPVDWSPSGGTASVTAYRQGSPLATRVGITADKADQRLWLRAIPPATITVSGSAINYDPTSKYFVVKSPQGTDRYQNLAPLPYTLQVPANTPFTLIGATFADNNNASTPREENSTYTGWVRRDFPASSTDITGADLDFSKPLPQLQTSGTIEFPPNPNSPLFTDSQPYFQVSRPDNVGFFGAPTLTVISADGASASYQGSYVQVAGINDITTDFQLYVPEGFSFVRLHGYPVNGAVVEGFLEQPVVIQPADPMTPVDITDPIVWRVLDPESRGTLLLSQPTPAPGRIVWEINSASPVPTLVLPKTPPGIDSASTFGTTALSGFIQLGVDCDPPEDFGYFSCDRGTVPTSQLLTVNPPK